MEHAPSTTVGLHTFAPESRPSAARSAQNCTIPSFRCGPGGPFESPAERKHAKCDCSTRVTRFPGGTPRNLAARGGAPGSRFSSGDHETTFSGRGCVPRFSSSCRRNRGAGRQNPVPGHHAMFRERHPHGCGLGPVEAGHQEGASSTVAEQGGGQPCGGNGYQSEPEEHPASAGDVEERGRDPRAWCTVRTDVLLCAPSERLRPEPIRPVSGGTWLMQPSFAAAARRQR
jgi:hypothetical protein